MEHYMYQDELFEKTLKRKVDEYKMYPSDKSWSNIQNRLNNSNKFNWKSIVAIIILISASISLSTHTEPGFINPFVTEIAVKNSGTDISSENKSVIYKRSTNQQLARSTANSAITIVPDAPVADAKTSSDLIITDQESIPLVKEIQPVTEKISTGTAAVPSLTIPHKVKHIQAVINNTSTDERIAQQKENETTLLQIVTQDIRVSDDFIPQTVFKPIAEGTATLIANSKEEVTVTNENNPVQQSDAQLNYEVKVPVFVKQKPTRMLLFYVAPSSSYRVLVSKNRYWFGNLPQNDVENVVNHKASLGTEVGAAIIVPITRKIRFKTGLQLNYTKYVVEAYTKTPELTSVQVNNTRIVRPSTLANRSGYRITEVANKTFQLALPVGIEVTMAGNSKTQWNIAGTIQPAYLMQATGYLITSDYKSYIKAPDLLSNMNLNTSFETFIRWNAGKFDLQAGPQLRYQLFSNTEKGYPIREHLVDYGFKIGIIKMLR